MASGPQYPLGNLVGGFWEQWTTSAGQEYYKNLNTGATQYEIPRGWEDLDTDTWTHDRTRTWQQWQNTRTGRRTAEDPYPPAAQIYLDDPNVKAHLVLVERAPESHEYLYRRVMSNVLRYSFPINRNFDVVQEESRGEVTEGESRVDLVVLKIIARPGGTHYSYDYCLIESKMAHKDWDDAQDHLSRHCAGTENPSQRVYGMVHIGLWVQFFSADRGILTTLSGRLHLRNDVAAVTAMFDSMKRSPLPFL